MAWTQLSIRKSLLGDVFDFVKESGFSSAAAAEVVTDLVFNLAEYREEGVSLFPSVFLIDGPSETKVLASLAPGCERILLGKSPVKDCAAKCLKDSAPLAERGWAIFLSLDDTEARYGLFRAFQLPISVSASESLIGRELEAGPVILVRNCASKCVEIADGTGQHLELSLTPAAPSSQAVSTHLTLLAQSIVSDVPKEERAALEGYFARILTESIRSSHGSLIAVVKAELARLPDEFVEFVGLDTPLGFRDSFQSLVSSGEAAALSQLQARETLLRGMIASDGVTIMGTDATMRAFRLFLRPTKEESEAMVKSAVRGGGRTRAFEVLKARLGSPFVAAFFRSQDGRTEFVSVAK